MLRSRYIDTGKVRFVFREFPLDIKAAAASMLARCIAKDDSEKYLGAVEILFKQQERLMAQTKDTLIFIGKLNGMSEQDVEACEKDQALLDKLAADQRYALDTLKVDSTPTFFVNGETAEGRDVVRGAGREADAAVEAVKRFRAKWMPIRVRKTRQNKRPRLWL